jgi:hypothetical protein
MEQAPNTAPAPAPYQRERITRFVITNLIAIGLAVLIFGGLLYGASLDRVFKSIFDAFYTYDILAVAAAISPIFGTVLIGTYYAGRRKKKQQEGGQ